MLSPARLSVCLPADGERAAVKGGSAGTLRVQARVSRDALLQQQRAAVWEDSQQICHTGEAFTPVSRARVATVDICGVCSLGLTERLCPQMQLRFDGLLGFPGG